MLRTSWVRRSRANIQMEPTLPAVAPSWRREARLIWRVSRINNEENQFRSKSQEKYAVGSGGCERRGSLWHVIEPLVATGYARPAARTGSERRGFGRRQPGASWRR